MVTASGRLLRPERAALPTFWQIGIWRNVASQIARDPLLPIAQIDALLQQASVPNELHSAFRAIVGRHRRYGRRALTAEKAQQLGESSQRLRAVGDIPTRDEGAILDEVMQLRVEAFGQRAVQRIEASGGLGLATPDIAVMEGPEFPAYVRGLPKRLDEWGATQHGVTLATFRSWRTKLRKSGELTTPPRRGRAMRVRDN